MDWVLNDDRPIWVQLAEQLRFRIVSCLYPRGERLPSVRDLAAEAGVNPNTMQRALAQLEEDGLAVSNRTTGRTVTTDENIIDTVRRKLAEENIDAYFAAMARIGYGREEALSLLNGRGED